MTFVKGILSIFERQILKNDVFNDNDFWSKVILVIFFLQQILLKDVSNDNENV